MVSRFLVQFPFRELIAKFTREYYRHVLFQNLVLLGIVTLPIIHFVTNFWEQILIGNR